ncbi:MAG: cell division protein FtsQ/DivIB [Paramuribaculum sp.]|nr:cell division protein FtsQ/DivIB [Paramuribaculum sp.]
MTQRKTDIHAKQRHKRRRRTAIEAVVAVALALYLVVTLTVAANVGDERLCSGMRIAVNDTASHKFVTAAELAKELGAVPAAAKGMRLLDVNTDSIERLLNSIDKIEDASVVRLTDGSVMVTVNPLHPVARVFDSKGSYYINRVGKRITADARYHLDVPVIQGDFVDSVFAATSVLPLIEYISRDSVWNSFVSMIKVDSPSDIILVPIVRGQVINFGRADGFEDKFARLKRMYAEVLPVKGWSYYDTISVKWDGQIVATRRHKKLPAPKFADDDEVEDVAVDAMLAGDKVAPGQVIPGKKAKDDKPIPAAVKKGN